MATANLERALRIVSVERGRDPRRYALVGFGGAGPLHAARLARQVGIPTVIIPNGAGVGSAVGLLEAEPRLDHALTRITPLEPGVLAMARRTIDSLAQRVLADIGRLGGEDPAVLRHSASARYAGQGYEITIDLPSLDDAEDGFIAAVAAAFSKAYRRIYGFDDPGRAIELIDWTVAATVPTTVAASRPQPIASTTPAAAARRMAYFPECGGLIEVATHDRYALAPGEPVYGPCIVEERESTIVLLPGDVGRTSVAGNLIISIREVA